MARHGLERIIGELEFFRGLPPDDVAFITGCAENVTFPAGHTLFRTGEPAERFHVVREGRVALEVEVPGRGILVVDTAEAGEVAGVSWLFPPYRWNFDARAVEQVHAMAFDARCLRDKCDAEPRLGYELMKRFAALVIRRLQSARIRLIDVYGGARVG